MRGREIISARNILTVPCSVECVSDLVVHDETESDKHIQWL